MYQMEPEDNVEFVENRRKSSDKSFVCKCKNAGARLIQNTRRRSTRCVMIYGIAGCVLLTINVVFLTLSLAIMAVGALLEWGRDFISSVITPALAASAAGAAAAGSSQAVTLNTITDLVGEYVSVLTSSGIVIFIIGCVLGCISIAALCGVCCKSKILLAVYIVCMGVILLVVTIILIVFVVKRDELQVFVATQLQFNLAFKFTGVYNPTGMTGLINLIQSQFECCGVYNSSDYAAATNWNRTFQIDYGDGNPLVVTLAAPLTCCKLKTNSFEPIEPNCTFAPTISNSNFKTGCYTKIWEIIEIFALYAIYGMAALCGILMVLIIIASLLVRSYAKEAITPV